MRWLVAHPGPNFSVHDVYTGWVEGLREIGEKVVEFNLGERLDFYSQALIDRDGAVRPALTADQATDMAVNGIYATAFKARPDVLLAVSGFFLPPEVFDRLKRSGTRVVILHTESPYEDDRQLKLAPYADVNLVNDPTNLGRYAELGAAAYVPHAYRPALHHPGSPDPDMACDLAFVGTGYPSRVEFFEQMNLDGLDVALAGNWQGLADDSPLRKHIAHDLAECCDNTETARLYRSAAAGLNLYRREAQRPELSAGWAMGPREVEMAACGLFFARDARGEGDEVLPMLPAFTTPAQASDIVRWYLDHPAERDRLAGLAREAVIGRTFEHHAAVLRRLLD